MGAGRLIVGMMSEGILIVRLVIVGGQIVGLQSEGVLIVGAPIVETVRLLQHHTKYNTKIEHHILLVGTSSPSLPSSLHDA